MIRGGLPALRALRSALRHPPRDGAYARALLGEDHAWNLGELLLAGMLDTLRAGNWQRGGGKGPKPRPIPRPGVGRGTKIGNAGGRTPEQVKAMLAKMAGRP